MNSEKEVKKFEANLPFEIRKAKGLILDALESGPITGFGVLEQIVFEDLTLKRDRWGEVVYSDETGIPFHRTKPVHRLAVVKAYKILEQEDSIIIERPGNVPFSMTDNQTVFSVQKK